MREIPDEVGEGLKNADVQWKPKASNTSTAQIFVQVTTRALFFFYWVQTDTILD